METLLQDVRYGIRMLRKSPGFTSVALLVLTVGIGANVAIFSVVNTVLLRPLPYHDPARLVMLWESLPGIGYGQLGTSSGEYLDYRDRNRVFSGIAGYKNDTANLTGSGQPERIHLTQATANLFSVLGVQPSIGRTYTAEEDRPGAGKVAVLSYGLWKRRYGGDRNILGRAVDLDGQPYTVIGVMPASFQFPFSTLPYSEQAELWVPVAFTRDEITDRVREFGTFTVGRLKPGVSLQQAQEDVTRVAAEFQKQYPQVYSGNIYVKPAVRSLAADIVGNVRPMLLVLLGAVGFVLLIACANLANLLLARATARAREMAVRAALGASQTRLLRQFLTESLLLAGAGGALGLFAAFWLVRLLVAFGPEQVPRLHDVTIDPAVLAFAVAVSVLTGILFGIAPAWRASGGELQPALKEATARAGASRKKLRLRNGLVVLETACSLLLLVGAGLLVNSFIRVLRVPPGFNPNGVLIARTQFDDTRYPKAEFCGVAEREIIARLRRLPGVESAGFVTNLPLADPRGIGFRIEGGPANEFHNADNALVSEGYFQAMGIPLLRGRGFREQDTASTPLVAVINQTLARTYFSGADPVGKRLLWGDRAPFTIVGIAGDVKFSALDADVAPMIYMSNFQVSSGVSRHAVFVVRTAGDPASLASTASRTIWSVDKDLPVFGVTTMNEVLAASVAQRRFSMSLLGGFAVLALLMAAIGLYGVLSYSVSQRMHEMGLRMALGANARDLMRLVVGQGIRVVLAGVIAGLLASFAATRLLAGMLFGVSPLDPFTFATVAGVLVAAALLASFVPARRATRVDPMVARRYE
ncbi:MAG TPA: ABC transporter permease [Terriglobales bacterium]